MISIFCFVYFEDQKPLKYDALELSYFTSHTMVPEIEKYSMSDVKYVLLAVAVFWLVFYLFLTFDLTTLKSLICCWSNRRRRQRNSASIWVRSSGYLVFIVIFQLVSTAFATCGCMSLYRVPLNTTIYSIVFALMSK